MGELGKIYEESELRKIVDESIDIKNGDYRTNPDFIKLNEGYISELGRYVTGAWWVENHLVGQERLEKLYGPYDMRVHRKLLPEETKEEVLFSLLADKYEDKSRTPKDIYRYFYRNEEKEETKLGLFKRMKKIGFDWDRFGKDDKRIKLMYFLYCFELENKVKIGAFLGNPTLENVDNLCVGLSHKNSQLMSKLKRGVAMDINPIYQAAVNNALVAIATHWEEQIRKIIAYLDFSINDSYLETLRRISFQIEGCVQMIGEAKNLPYENAILESFYLKLAQHESLGRESDILDINLTCVPDETEVTYRPEVFEALAYQPLKRVEMYDYLRNNKDKLLPLVFEKDDISTYEKRRYDKVLENLKNFMDMVETHTKATESEIVPKLYAIVFMQEFLNIDKSEKIDNKYYRYQTGELKSLYTELALGDEARIKSQLAIPRRVTRRMYKYAAKTEIAELAFAAEVCIDRILMRIYQCNNLNDMLFVHNFFMNLTDTIFLADKQLEEAFKRLNKNIKRKKADYRWIIHDVNKYRYFMGTIYNSPIIDDLGKKIGKSIQKIELTKHRQGMYWPIELTENYIGISDNYKLEVIIDPNEKTIELLDFYIDPNLQLRGVLIRNSLM